MFDLKKVAGYYNEKGNVSNAVRNGIKEKAVPLIVSALGELPNGAELGKDNAIYVPLFENEVGEVIYARGEFTITTKDPSAEVVRADRKKKEKNEVVIPELD